MFGYGWNPMKPHPLRPEELARKLALMEGVELAPHDLLEDMKEHPSLYFADHVVMSRQNRVLPLSSTGWEWACRAL